MARGPSRWSVFKNGTIEMLQKKWSRWFFVVVVAQAIVCTIFEAYTFGLFQDGLTSAVDDPSLNTNEINAQLKTIPTFLGLFILGFLFQVVLTWDALIAKNTIQIIGISISNLALLVYGGLQIDQIHTAIVKLNVYNAFGSDDIWAKTRGELIAIPGIIGVISFVLAYFSWKLYQDFAWDILKQIGADYRMRKRFLHYQIYIALLKFDFFFFVGFTIQFLVVVGGKTTVEEALTAAAVPVTIAILLCAAWFTRREWKFGMICVMILYLGGLAYFTFKLARIYQPAEEEPYKPVRKSLTAFAVLTIILILLTILNALVCMFNFGHGLKQHLLSRPQGVDKDQVSYSMHDVKQPQAPSRMTID